MSVQFINKLLDEAYRVTNDAFGRGVVDKARQEVTVTRHNLAQAYKEAFSREHIAEFPNSPDPFEGDDKIFYRAALKGLNALDVHLKKKNTLSNYKKPRTANTIVFTQPSHVATPYTIMKKAGVAHIQTELAALNKSPLSKAQEKSIETSIHKLHGETTAGTARLAYTLNHLGRNSIVKSFFSSLQYTRIENKYGDLSIQFEIVDKAEKKTDQIKAINIIRLHIAARSKNFAGSDHNDWTRIKPKLTKELRIWARKHNWADQKGSPSIKDKAIGKVTKEVLDIFDKYPEMKVTRAVKKTPPMKRAKQTKVYKGKKGGTAAQVNATTKIPRQAARASDTTGIAAILGDLKAQLHGQIRSRMGVDGVDDTSGPLVYRSGEFAKSIEITGVSSFARSRTTALHYTFDAYPYDVFSRGHKLYTPERDPEILIDQSIRAIVGKRLGQRFYTKRTY